MELTKKKAKKICLEVWKWLRDNPDIGDKADLPEKIYSKISGLDCYCPLCVLYRLPDCNQCFLKKVRSGVGNCDYFYKWNNAKTSKTRKKYAGIIVEKVKAWQV